MGCGTRLATTTRRARACSGFTTTARCAAIARATTRTTTPKPRGGQVRYDTTRHDTHTRAYTTAKASLCMLTTRSPGASTTANAPDVPWWSCRRQYSNTLTTPTPLHPLVLPYPLILPPPPRRRQSGACAVLDVWGTPAGCPRGPGRGRAARGPTPRCRTCSKAGPGEGAPRGSSL